MREKEAHHGIERRREGRNRVFNGGLPGETLAGEREGRMERDGKKKKTIQKRRLFVLCSASSRRFLMLLPRPTSLRNLHSHLLLSSLLSYSISSPLTLVRRSTSSPVSSFSSPPLGMVYFPSAFRAYRYQVRVRYT